MLFPPCSPQEKKKKKRLWLITKGHLLTKYILKLFFGLCIKHFCFAELYGDVSETSLQKIFRLTVFPDKQSRITSSRFKNTVTCANGNTVKLFILFNPEGK